MKPSRVRFSQIAAVLLLAAATRGQCDTPPGVIIDRSPDFQKIYVGCPSIARLPDGGYVASHSWFGPGTKNDTSEVFASADRGKTWRKLTTLKGQWWSTIFVHRGQLYILGVTREYGDIVIRRSDDGGKTWTEPKDSRSGLLFKGKYHCAPVPVIVHDGRIWRAFELAEGLRPQWSALVLSAPETANLLDAANWLMSDKLQHLWSLSQWIEGNMVVAPDKKLVNILRTDNGPDRAAIVHVSNDGTGLSHDRAKDLIAFPGGGSKFTIRFDPQTKRYWSLGNKQSDPPAGRNVLALSSSADLRNWKVETILLRHADSRNHAWQYVDWLFDNDDLVVVSRTAWDDSHNFHDANYFTFHRIANFRDKTMADAAPTMRQAARCENADLVVTGGGWTEAKLANGERAFANRNYVWKSVPDKFRNWRITQTAGGEPAEIRVKAKRDAAVFAATAQQPGSDFKDWNAAANAAFRYTDKGQTPMTVYCRTLKAGQEIAVPQGNWSGLMVMLPPDGVSVAALAAAAQPLERLKYNNPGLVVDLGVGLWAFPLPMDFDGDGNLDLVVDCPDKPYNGVYFFKNPSGDAAKQKFPTFKPGKRISKGLQFAEVSYVDGRPRVLTPGNEYPDFLKTGLDAPAKLPLPVNIHANKVRGNFWRYVDYDGDGKMDVIVGADDWTDYGWDNAYDASGKWTNGPLRGFVYVVRNKGTNEKPIYEPPFQVMAGGQPVETFGWPSPCFADFDGDGDLDLICGEFRDSFTYFENIGTRTQPKYAPGRKLKTPDGKPLVMDLEMITPTAIDWNKDGQIDLVVGDEDGRVALVEHTGKVVNGTPQFLPPRYFQQEADELKFGALATPVGFDWDGDGDTDLICGNSAGYIALFENLSGPGVERPRWAAPKLLEADGKPIRIMAGLNGSIQGPCEAKWGYTTQSVADWDGDGLPDLIVNSIWGKVVWYRNIGTRQAPKLAAAMPIEVEWEGPQPTLAYGWLRPEGKALLTQWRTTPVAVDWNGDGLTDLIMLDHEGYLAFFERARRDGKLVLLPPKRVLCDEKGEPLRLNAGIAGRSGRRKLCIVDWDGDGKLDILLNAANARFLRQVESRDGKWLFKDMGLLVEQNIEGHDVSPTVVDFNGDGIPDFVGGAEDGRFYYYRNPRSKQAAVAPITNNAEWKNGKPIALPGVKRPKVESVLIYQPTTEWTYSHHQSITFFKDRFYAIWSNGRQDEDAPGQRVLMASSADFKNWTAPRPLIDSVKDENGVERVLTAAGFHQHEDTLVAYFGNYGPNKETTHLQAVTTTDGEHWSAPREMGIPVNPNHPPQRTASGRLIIAGNISFPYTDDPAGLSGWRMAGIYPASMAATIKDDPASFWEVAKQQRWDTGLCEGSFYQTDDGALHMLLRNAAKQNTRRLWLTESRDNGATWSTPVETAFSDTNAKFHFGRLPDGRFYYVGNPIGGGRTPLALSLSRDGVTFDQHLILGDTHYESRRQGRWKGGEYGYPHTLIHDGWLYVIVSRQKEAVEVLRVALAELQ